MFETKRLPVGRDVVAPDGSDVRTGVQLASTSLAEVGWKKVDEFTNLLRCKATDWFAVYDVWDNDGVEPVGTPETVRPLYHVRSLLLRQSP